MLTLTILLAFAWMLINEAFTLADLLVGLIFGFLVIRVSWRLLTDEPFSLSSYFRFISRNPLVMTWKWLRFLGFGFGEIVKSNLVVARAVLSPTLRLRPGIVAIPLDLQSDQGITILANLITLTPGTVTLDISSDRKTLYIHAFNVADAEQLRNEIKDSFERRVQELFP
ncbi:MAG: Na+/H+ antiporter subunit E [Oscillochloris sp.]|nr:Na+/H+ antiporter subunit E [Oscillochloris sp.]